MSLRERILDASKALAVEAIEDPLATADDKREARKFLKSLTRANHQVSTDDELIVAEYIAERAQGRVPSEPEAAYRSAALRMGLAGIPDEKLAAIARVLTQDLVGEPDAAYRSAVLRIALVAMTDEQLDAIVSALAGT